MLMGLSPDNARRRKCLSNSQMFLIACHEVIMNQTSNVFVSTAKESVERLNMISLDRIATRRCKTNVNQYAHMLSSTKYCYVDISTMYTTALQIIHVCF